MTSKKKPKSTPDTAPLPMPTAVGTAPTICPSPLYARSPVSDPSGTDPTTTISLPSYLPINTPTPVATNSLVDPNEEFKTVANYTVEAIPFLTTNISYESETVLLQL